MWSEPPETGATNHFLAHLLFFLAKETFSKRLYLAVDGIVVTKHQPAPNAGCKERMKWDFFPLHPGLRCQEPLVGEHKIGQVSGMSVRSLGNGFQFLP